MDSNENVIVELLQETSMVSGEVDLASLELSQRKLQAELKMKRNQVEQLREQEDTQNVKIHELKRDLDASKTRISELEFELDITKNTCASYNMQLKSASTVQLKMQLEKLQIENRCLKEMLQKSEEEKCTLVRKVEDLAALNELESAQKKDLFEQDKKIKTDMEKVLRSFQEIEKESLKIKNIYDQLQQVKDSQHYISVYKQIADDAVAKRNETEEQCLITKAKLDTLTDLLKNYPLPQSAPPINTEHYKQQIVKLQKELDEERELTIQQNKRLATEIAQNVTLCLQVDSLERDVAGSTKCMKDICIQTMNLD